MDKSRRLSLPALDLGCIWRITSPKDKNYHTNVPIIEPDDLPTVFLRSTFPTGTKSVLADHLHHFSLDLQMIRVFDFDILYIGICRSEDDPVIFLVKVL